MRRRVRVEVFDLWPLLLHNVRYSMHRRSTAPSTCLDCLRHYVHFLPRHQVEQIRGEIAAELSGNEQVGDPCDTQVWRAALGHLDRVLAS